MRYDSPVIASRPRFLGSLDQRSYKIGSWQEIVGRLPENLPDRGEQPNAGRFRLDVPSVQPRGVTLQPCQLFPVRHLGDGLER
jgi:hypothetical protein